MKFSFFLTAFISGLGLCGIDKKPVAGQTADNNPGTETFSPFKRWRGVFTIKAGTEVPFNFEITGSTRADARTYFLNGEERFDGGQVAWSRDSLFISLDQFENELAFAISGNDLLQGVLRKQNGGGLHTPVKAESGKDYRFAPGRSEEVTDISGTYAVEFKKPDGSIEKAVGLFSQEGSLLKGTFLRTTGDSRFLEGIVDGNRFFLSSFIGSSPSYYQGTIDPATKQLTGEITGSRSSQPFTALPDEAAALPDPYQLTLLKNGYSTLSFSFPDAAGNTVSLSDKKFQHKVVIISITGSWCPNCYDEASFLAPWYKKNKDRGVEVIALHYERRDDTAYLSKALNRFRDKLGITYTQLFAGLADKQYVAASLPALNTFLSFPTTIFIDKKGKVSKIHTGYSGPATGKYYTQFVKEFNDEVDRLLKQ